LNKRQADLTDGLHAFCQVTTISSTTHSVHPTVPDGTLAVPTYATMAKSISPQTSPSKAYWWAICFSINRQPSTLPLIQSIE